MIAARNLRTGARRIVANESGKATFGGPETSALALVKRCVNGERIGHRWVVNVP